MVQFDFNRSDIRHVHFIGIGGISMSAIAEVLLNLGYTISGSDMNSSKITDKLKMKGATINIGHKADYLPMCDLVVYTAAIQPNNPELLKARAFHIPIIDRAEMLGLLMKKFKNSVAVSGTHGKTTTTSMISLILEYSQYDPTILVGGELDEIGGNVKIGGRDYFITEACEYVESFLKFFPTMGVILNIDADHLDYFKDMKHIIQSFTKFAQLLPVNGHLIAFNDDDNIKEILPVVKANIITYGRGDDSHYQAHNISYSSEGFPSFDVTYLGQPIGRFHLSIPGIHNIYNSLAAIACCRVLGIPVEEIQRNLNRFKGTHRRFDILGKVKDITLVDDYAHHPTEVKATLEAASRYPHNKLWCIFQPHTYTRTKTLINDFASSFQYADRVIVTDIYAARERDPGDIHSKDLSHAIEGHHQAVQYMNSFDVVVEYLEQHIQPGDLVLTMGAGDIYKVGEKLLSKLKG